MNVPVQLTPKDICSITGVTIMTVHIWRVGKMIEKSNLPFKLIPRGGKRNYVKIDSNDFMEWADKYGINYDFSKLNGNDSEKQ